MTYMKKIFETLKNKVVLVITLLICLNLYTCTRSCSSSRHAKKAEKELVMKDSVISSRDDSIKVLNKRIEVIETEAKGLEKTLQVQGEAINQITEAKKNINIVVRQKK